MLVLLWNRGHNIMGSETAKSVLSSFRWVSGPLRSVVASCLGLSAAIAVKASGGSLLVAACVGILCALPSIISYHLELPGKVRRCLSAISLAFATLLLLKCKCKPLEIAVLTAITLFALLDMFVCRFGERKDLIFDVHGGAKGVAKVIDVSYLILVLVFSVLVAMRSQTFADSTVIRIVIDSFAWCRDRHKELKNMALV